MAERQTYQTMTADQANDLDAVVDGLLDRMIAITRSVSNMTATDRELSALGGAIERLVQTSLQRLSAPGQLDSGDAFINATRVAVASAAIHLAALDPAAKVPLAIIAAQGLSQGLNRRCGCPDCQRGTTSSRRAH